jgi:flagellar basal body rod protein FlgG
MTRQDVVANNIANVNTVGFKQLRTDQEDFTIGSHNALGVQLGELGTATLPGSLRLDVSEGAIEATNIVSDLAIEGDGLFVVRTGNGVAYSRAGDFVVDATGMLVTHQGYPVLDTAGHTIQTGQSFIVRPDGTVVGTGQRIALVAWPVGGITRLGENLYSAAGQLPPASGTIRQSALEHSNTDMALQMSEMISLQHSYQFTARALSIQDGSLDSAVQLGRLR